MKRSYGFQGLNLPIKVDYLSGPVASEAVFKNLTGIRLLQWRAAQEVYDYPFVRLKSIRELAVRGIKKICKKNGIVEFFLQAILPGKWTIEDEYKNCLQNAIRDLKEGRSAIAICCGQFVGMCSYKIGGQLSDGTDLHETTRAVVLKPFRGLGIFKKLRAMAIELANQRQDDIKYWISSSRNPAVIKTCVSEGYLEFNVQEYFKMANRVNSDAWTETMITNGNSHPGGNPWRAFVKNVVGGAIHPDFKIDSNQIHLSESPSETCRRVVRRSPSETLNIN